MKTLPQTCEQCLEEFSTALEELVIYASRGEKKPGTPKPNPEI
ncbi:hypothetical protein [Algoriphagus boritolerans]